MTRGRLARRDPQGQLVHRVHRARLAPPVLPDRLVRRALTVQQELSGPLDRRAPLDLTEPPEPPEPREPRVLRARWGRRERQALRDLRGHQDPPDWRDLRVPQDQRDRQALLVRSERRGRMAHQACLAQLASRGWRGRRGQWALKDRKAHRERLDQQVPLVRQGPLDRKECQVLPGRLDRRVSRPN